MPPRREGWIDWRHSRARAMILDHLENETLPLKEEELSAIDAWTQRYSHLPEFHGIQFSQFEARLIDHRSQVLNKKKHISSQLDALARDRVLHPPPTHNKKGERVFYLSLAYPKLVEDVTDEKHLNMTVGQLFYSRPEYYEDWKYEVFADRVKQEVMRQKFVYHCEVKRANKAAKAARKRQADNSNGRP